MIILHELGVVFEVVKTIEKVAVKQNLTKIDTLVLQIGELSSMIPKYIEECFPAAADGTILENTKLEIEIIPGNVICKDCNNIFNVLKEGKICPNCGSNNVQLLSGKEFNIKEVIAY